MKKIWAMRKDFSAVSPVIATILMVAITVVLAAVLYVMVLGIGGGGGAAPPITLTSAASQDGTKWVVSVITVQSTTGVAKTTISVKVTTPDGTQRIYETLDKFISSTPAVPTDGILGVNYTDSNKLNANIEAGDSFTIAKGSAYDDHPALYPSGTKVELYHTNGLSGSTTL